MEMPGANHVGNNGKPHLGKEKHTPQIGQTDVDHHARSVGRAPVDTTGGTEFLFVGGAFPIQVRKANLLLLHFDYFEASSPKGDEKVPE